MCCLWLDETLQRYTLVKPYGLPLHPMEQDWCQGHRHLFGSNQQAGLPLMQVNACDYPAPQLLLRQHPIHQHWAMWWKVPQNLCRVGMQGSYQASHWPLAHSKCYPGRYKPVVPPEHRRYAQKTREPTPVQGYRKVSDAIEGEYTWLLLPLKQNSLPSLFRSTQDISRPAHRLYQPLLAALL